jgi:hypothetical protein
MHPVRPVHAQSRAPSPGFLAFRSPMRTSLAAPARARHRALPPGPGACPARPAALCRPSRPSIVALCPYPLMIEGRMGSTCAGGRGRPRQPVRCMRSLVLDPRARAGVDRWARRQAQNGAAAASSQVRRTWPPPIEGFIAVPRGDRTRLDF